MDSFLWILPVLALCLVLLLALWLFSARLLTPVKKCRGACLHAVVSASGEADALEQSVRGLLWLIHSGRLDCDILIVDAGLSTQALAKAELLARDEARIHLCSGSIRFTEDTWRNIEL